MSIAALVKTLLDAGVDPETIVAAVASVEPQAQTRTARQERNARYYENRKERLKASENRLKTSKQDKEVPPHTPLQENQVPKEKTPKGVQKKGQPSAIDALEGVLSPDMAKAVAEHRQKIRKPLTPAAAGLLAKQFARVADPNAAAAKMLERGWQGFNPDWAPELSAQSPATGPPIEVAPQFSTEEEFQDWWNKRQAGK